MSDVDFGEYELPAPVYGEVAVEYARIGGALDAATSAAAAIAAVEQWDALRRRLGSWGVLASIRFQQDTRNEEYKRTRELRDELEPKLTNLAVGMKRKLVASPHRDALIEHFGAQAFEMWRCDIASFDPAIDEDLVEQAKLEASYTELLASAKFEFQGKMQTLEDMKALNDHHDRQVRHEAGRLRWGWFATHQAQLDVIFDGLVGRRQAMAEKLGRENFVSVGYERMQRVGYGQAEVERFRAQVRELVVPLAVEIRARQRERLGVEQLRWWDEAVQDSRGCPRPLDGHEWMAERASEMFARLDPRLDSFFAQMRARNTIDFESREGKGGGGFCEVVPSFGLPFIFGSCTGTKIDAMVFTHEMGHAFQGYLGLDQPLWENIYPTIETCEIHSTALEFLTWPQMDLFFGEDGERFRQQHLLDRLLFLPYGVAVDQFQHLIYAYPEASPDERAEMWQEMEQTYLPWRKYGDLAHPASGRFWQGQLHIYRFPFYFIDYALALTVALQLWELAARDQPAAMEKFVELCRRGGELAFGELVKSVGLVSPFEEGCLERVVECAQREITGAN
jgi:M3 family oligoendopeptidase